MGLQPAASAGHTEIYIKCNQEPKLEWEMQEGSSSLGHSSVAAL